MRADEQLAGLGNTKRRDTMQRSYMISDFRAYSCLGDRPVAAEARLAGVYCITSGLCRRAVQVTLAVSQ